MRGIVSVILDDPFRVHIEGYSTIALFDGDPIDPIFLLISPDYNISLNKSVQRSKYEYYTMIQLTAILNRNLGHTIDISAKQDYNKRELMLSAIWNYGAVNVNLETGNFKSAMIT